MRQLFYEVLRQLVCEGDLPADHPLRCCPYDPFSRGSTCEEKQAVEALESFLGYWYARQLRRLYYGYRQAYRRMGALHAGIACLTLEDADIRQLLRSHTDDGEVFPRVYQPDAQAEARFQQKVRQSNRSIECRAFFDAPAAPKIYEAA